MMREKNYVTGEDAIWLMTFQNNLRFISRNKKISLAMLGRKLDMPTHEVNKCLYGSTKPSDELVKKVADILDCTIDDLLDEDGNPENFGKTAEEIAELNAIRKREREDN